MALVVLLALLPIRDRGSAAAAGPRLLQALTPNAYLMSAIVHISTRELRDRS